MTIFVNIASYKDPLLWDTVNDCIKNATNPYELRFGVVDQTEKEFDIKSHPYSNQINYFYFSSYISRGPCWARSLGYGLYNGEDYVLQIDAHTVFDEGWDTMLIRKLHECESMSQKCILSTYPSEFNLIDGIAHKNKQSNFTSLIRPKDGSRISDHDPSFTAIGYTINTSEPKLGIHIAGGFIFTRGNFFLQVPYDPALYFTGEEQSLMIRAWTRGWDVYHIPDAPLYHLYYKREHRNLHWDYNEDRERHVKWAVLREKSRRRLRELLLEGKDLGVYGLGTQRTIEQFAEFSGIDYPKREIRFKPIS